MSIRKIPLAFYSVAFMLLPLLVFADEPCLPCGEIITNAPLPTPSDCNQVAPFQNFIATQECCPIRGAWNGFYIGTGFGGGVVDLNLKIPGITVQTNNKNISSITNHYFIEYATIGYSHVINRFFIAGEFGYYYHSTTKPIFYEDPSSLTLISAAGEPVDIFATVCGVRLDINAHNHVAFDLLPGFAFTPQFSIFGRVGLEYTSWNWKRRLCVPNILVDEIPLFDIPFALIVADEEIGDTQTDNLIDLRLGAGISFAVTPHIAFNLNYVHIVGSKATFNPNLTTLQNGLAVIEGIFIDDPINDTIIEDFDTLAAQNRIDPNRNELLFGVTFTF